MSMSLFILWNSFQREIEIVRGRENYILWIILPKCQQRGLDQAAVRWQESQVSLPCRWQTQLKEHHWLPPCTLTGSWNQECSANWNPSILIWDAGIPSSIFKIIILTLKDWFERVAEKGKNRNLPSAGWLPKRLQRPELDQKEARSQELH